MTSYETVLNAFRDNNLHVYEKGNRASAQAPGHGDGDKSISLAYTEGRTLLYPHAGETVDDVLDAIGLTTKDLFDDDGITYQYPDGRQVHRGVDKTFRQSGNRSGTSLYRADKLDSADTIYLVEGEQDVHSVEAAGGTATCNPGGAAKLHLSDLTPLHGKHVIVVRDQDAAGIKHAHQAVDLLTGKAASITVMVGRAGNKDFTDHYVSGGSLGDLESDAQFGKSLLVARVKNLLEQADHLTAEELTDTLYGALDQQIDANDTGLHTFSEVLKDWWEWFDSDAKVLETPWHELNEMLSGGLHLGRLYLIAGRPGAGKTLGLDNFAEHAALHGHRGILYSMEMGRVEVASRFLSANGRAEYGQITRRSPDQENLMKIAQAAETLDGLPLLISDRTNINIRTLWDEIGRIQRTQGLDFVAIDYIQLMDGKGNNRQAELEYISRNLKAIALHYGIVVICAAQLNRDNTRDGRPPTVADLRGSGSLEQDADIVILLHHERTEDGDPTGMVDFIVDKNRSGTTGIISLPWRAHQSRIG